MLLELSNSVLGFPDAPKRVIFRTVKSHSENCPKNCKETHLKKMKETKEQLKFVARMMKEMKEQHKFVARKMKDISEDQKRIGFAVKAMTDAFPPNIGVVVPSEDCKSENSGKYQALMRALRLSEDCNVASLSVSIDSMLCDARISVSIGETSLRMLRMNLL